MTEAEMIQLAYDEGFAAAAIVDTGQIVFDPSFRPYDCFNEVGKSLFQEWDIVGFEKAVLGCGDNHFLYMAERIKETPNLFGELNATMPFLRFREEGQHYGYELFLSPPPYWGSRGAPLWWAYAARKLTQYTLPMDEETLFTLYTDVSKEFGINMKHDEP